MESTITQNGALFALHQTAREKYRRALQERTDAALNMALIKRTLQKLNVSAERTPRHIKSLVTFGTALFRRRSKSWQKMKVRPFLGTGSHNQSLSITSSMSPGRSDGQA